MNLWTRILVVLTAFFLTSIAVAAEFPTKPIKLVVPFPPGGAVDALGRLVGQKTSEILGQPIVIDNRAGAAGSIGTEIVAKSTPDGYTLLMGSTSSLSVIPNLQKVPYDPIKDFTPVSLVAYIPHVLVINNDVPAKTLAQFIAYAKANPGKLSYASSGNGTPHQIAVEMFKKMAGVFIVHIPYKGTAPGLTDLMSGQVALMSVELSTALPYIKAQKIRPLALLAPNRSTFAPDIPTAAQAGLPGLDITSWYGVVAPAGINRETLNILGTAIAKAVKSPDLNEKILGMGATPVGDTPEEFNLFMRKESAKWAKAIKESGAVAD
ncbi:MAG: tripartite tricarboxylate transporter substrate binding protein [Polynucleobacter sp.]